MATACRRGVHASESAASTSSRACVAVGDAEPFEEGLALEDVLLGARGLDDAGGDRAADLGRAFEVETGGDAGQEAGPEAVADAGRVDRDDAFDGADLDRVAARAGRR